MHFLHEVEARHAPVYLNGLIHERFIKDGHKVEMNYLWSRPAPVMKGWQPAPPELWLITKDKRYEFDCRASFGGFVVSADLFDALRDQAPGWHVSHLHVVNGRNEPIADKPYHFIQPGVELSLAEPIDKASSDFSTDEFGGIEEISRLAFNDPAKSRQVFVCMGEPILWPFIFIGDALATAMRNRKWSGVEIAAVESFRRDLRF